jgi:hypothetical protein
MAGEGAAVGQLEIALGAFECLYVRLLVDRQHQRLVGRGEVVELLRFSGERFAVYPASLSN